MKVYISTDFEGISGVLSNRQTSSDDKDEYEKSRHYLMSDINAAVEGCLLDWLRNVDVVELTPTLFT